jgi:hypothetical protein
MASIKILLVDDNREPNFYEPLADLANNLMKADLQQAYTFEEMQSILQESPYKYQGLILDGKGQKNERSKSEDNGYLFGTLRWLEQQRAKGLHYPYVVYTGYADELKERFSDEDIFWKGKSEEKAMMDTLRRKIKDTDFFQQSMLHPELFEAFGLSILDTKYQKELIGITQIADNTFTGDWNQLMRCIRPALECTLVNLDRIDRRLIPSGLIRNDQVDLGRILFHLAGSPDKGGTQTIYGSRQVIPTDIYCLTEQIRRLTNFAGMHHNDRSVSRFAIQSCTFAFLGYLEWLLSFVKSNYSNR